MWIVRWIVSAVFIILIIGFAMQNTDEQVVVTFVKWQSIPLPLWVVMYVSFIVGVAFWLFVSIFKILALKTQNRKSRKEVKALQDELDRLRNVSVEETEFPEGQFDEEVK